MHTFPLKNLFNPKVDYQEADDSSEVSEQTLSLLNYTLADLKWSMLV